MKYVSKPTVIEAVQYTGINTEELQDFAGDNFVFETDVLFATFAKVWDKLHESWIKVEPGNWIIRGTRGEFYPCADDVFREKYEPYEES